MTQAILCEVVNCVHNEGGQRCRAKEIFVVSHRGKKASTQEETDCKTFEPQL
ncbi:hypothetical protein N781_14265 [Pontibacillus halophilus JSM 076056 = DSM 19796]|uniref:DUF1540 domain-containing protein n=1 Tax=Pontibacillus halophilus JSM 076056 = DSM 19796 TaxID=1385510 RepID=A0A0A5GIG9_9BACI|nr:DUF1540 domain-containing protein [Pontibacillus halophilus]KGX93026.1 hypothetical protein N781_14265 [Pontibacillus halophilus JSM 076056 = DSM 19796]